MNLPQEFIDAINENDVLMLRIMLKDLMMIDPSFKKFEAYASACEQQVDDLYQEHDGAELQMDKSSWTKDYMNTQMVDLLDNFSRERVSHLKQVCRIIYSDRIIDQAVKNNTTHTSEKISPKKATGIAVAGVGTVAVVGGLIASSTAVVIAGTVAVVAGVAVVLTDK